jgi:hypothetical protein
MWVIESFTGRLPKIRELALINVGIDTRLRVRTVSGFPAALLSSGDRRARSTVKFGLRNLVYLSRMRPSGEWCCR